MEYEITENIKKAISDFEETIKNLQQKITQRNGDKILEKLNKVIEIVEELEKEEC